MMYERNLVNEARTIATMLDWSNTKKDASIEKWTRLLRDLAQTIEDQMSVIRHCEERNEWLEKRLNELEKSQCGKVETVKDR